MSVADTRAPTRPAGRTVDGDPARTIHATCVALDGHGLLLRGPSGAGKSDLALRLIDGGALLVADDRTVLSLRGGILRAAAPAALAGLLEVRGIGPRPVTAGAESAPVALIVDLVGAGAIERLPAAETEPLLGVAVPRVALDAIAAGTPAALRLLVAAMERSCGAWPVVDRPAGEDGS